MAGLSVAIGRPGAHRAPAPGPHWPARDRHAGIFFELRRHALHVAGRGEDEIQIAVIKRGVGLPEGIGQRRGKGEDAFSTRCEIRDFGYQRQTARTFVEGGRIPDPRRVAREIVIHEIFTNCGQFVLHRNAEILKQLAPGPMPETCRSCGDATAPPERMISRRA